MPTSEEKGGIKIPQKRPQLDLGLIYQRINWSSSSEKPVFSQKYTYITKRNVCASLF